MEQRCGAGAMHQRATVLGAAQQTDAHGEAFDLRKGERKIERLRDYNSLAGGGKARGVSGQKLLTQFRVWL